MALSSYNELVKQVASLKSENCHLRRELQDNSSHLTKLENDASNMKDVLSHIQVMFGEHNDPIDEQQLSEECRTETGVEACPDEDAMMTCHTSLCDGSFDGDDDMCQGQAIASSLEEGETSMTESAEGQVVDVFDLIHKLELERKHLLQELERDEQNRQWLLHGQGKAGSRGVDGVQQADKDSAQADVTRHQSECEAEKVQGAHLEKLGSVDQGKLRQEARLYRIQSIEAEMKSLQMCEIKLEQESSVGGPSAERTAAPRTLAAQTVEVHDGIAPGIPQSCNLQVMYHGAWPIEKGESGSSGPSFITPPTSQDLASVISFNSSHTNSSESNGVAAAAAAAAVSASSSAAAATSQPVTAASATGEPLQQLGTKTEMVCTLLSLLGTHDKDDMSRTLYAMSQSQDSCIAMRQSGCLPLLIQLLHGSEKDSGLLWKTRGSKSARARAAAALHNIVHYHHDDKRGRREARTLRLLEQIRAYCDQQRGGESEDDEEEAVVNGYATELDQHPGVAVAALMRLSFDEDYRHAICTLGGLQAITELLEIDDRVGALDPSLSEYSVKLRKYSCMALTNLTFGDGKNKSLLCSMRSAMEALTHQLGSSNEDLIQSAASVLRNLSWRADQASKKVLKEIGAVTVLMRTAMFVQKETTLKSILSALWNLSSHCSENKAEICAVEGALQFLVSLLTYKSPTKTLAIVENGGGILRNISSHIAVREDYRQILRKHDCLKILLLHLRSPSLSVVSNACGTLWNLSARCEEDQKTLWEMGAVNMLRNLVHSRQKMISNGSSAALRNLLSSNSAKGGGNGKIAESLHGSLHVRKQRAMEIELDSNLSETCENVESPGNSPTEILHRSESEPRRFVYGVNGAGVGVTSGGDRKDEVVRKTNVFQTIVSGADSDNIPGHVTASPGQVVRAGSQDSVGSTHSDISHDRTRAHAMLAKSSRLLHKCQGGLERKDQGSFLHGGMPQLNKTHVKMPDHRLQIGQNMLTSNGGLIVNNTPAHARQASLLYSQHPQHSQTWQTLPKSRIFQYLHEVALYAGIEPSTSSHGHSSLTQSAPSHVFHYPHTNSNQKILAKSSSSHTNFNAANIGSVDYNNHLSTTDEETDQPVNYSLKYQDVAYTERGNKHVPYNNLTPIANAGSFRSGTSSEHVRSGVVTMNKNNQLYSLNTSSISDKVPANNRKTATISSNNMINPSAITENKSFLGYNRFHTPRGCLSSGPSLHQPQFITPSASYPAASPFHSSVYLSSPGHPLRGPNTNLPPRSAAASTRFAPAGNTFTTSIDQFDPHQSVHKNVRSLRQFSSTYAETDLDVVVDQPTDFSLRYSEVSEESCSEDYQEQPINYSLQFRDSHGGDSQEMVVYGDERHCVECKYAEARRTNERIESSASEDQVQTFCTEGTPYLSTATSLTDLTQAGKHEGGDPENEGSSHSGDGSVDKLDDDISESRAEVNKAAGSLCSHVTDRHAASSTTTMVGIREFTCLF